MLDSQYYDGNHLYGYTHLYMKRQQYTGLNKHTKYCNCSTTALNMIILQIFVHLVHIYLVLTLGYHISLSIDFSSVVHLDTPISSDLQTDC